MRLLLDECIDRRLAKDLIEIDVRTVPQMGWAGLKNGKLLSVAEDHFEVFVTVDRNLSYQQRTSTFDLGVIVLRSVSNRHADLQPFAEKIIQTALIIEPGQ